jgi:sec-independent protein translocase protein TatA
MFETIGWQELLIILVIVLLIFGPKKLPDLGKNLGRSIRGFKNALSGKDKDTEDSATPAPPDNSK